VNTLWGRGRGGEEGRLTQNFSHKSQNQKVFSLPPLVYITPGLYVSIGGHRGGLRGKMFLPSLATDRHKRQPADRQTGKQIGR
jgi:hypothetical protein